MRATARLLVYLSLLTPLAASADVNDALYLCDVNQALHWIDGELKQDEIADSALGLTDRTLRFDAVTGLLRFALPRPSQFQIIQRGSFENDILAKRAVDGVGSYYLGTLRIRAWEEPISFLFVSNNFVYSGICRAE